MQHTYGGAVPGEHVHHQAVRTHVENSKGAKFIYCVVCNKKRIERKQDGQKKHTINSSPGTESET